MNVELAFLVMLYNAGYMAGHNDTVEGAFIPVPDWDTEHHADVVEGWVSDMTQEKVAPLTNEEMREFANTCLKRRDPAPTAKEEHGLTCGAWVHNGGTGLGSECDCGHPSGVVERSLKTQNPNGEENAAD